MAGDGMSEGVGTGGQTTAQRAPQSGRWLKIMAWQCPSQVTARHTQHTLLTHVRLCEAAPAAGRTERAGPTQRAKWRECAARLTCGALRRFLAHPQALRGYTHRWGGGRLGARQRLALPARDDARNLYAAVCGLREVHSKRLAERHGWRAANDR